MVPKLSHHDIYDASFDDALFEALPGRLAQEFDLPSAVFISVHPDDYREISAGTQPEANPRYEDVMRQDPWMAHATEEKIGAGAFRLSKFVSAGEFENSLMYNEFIRENRLDRFWCVGMLHGTRDGMVATAFHKGKIAGDFTDDELLAINHYARDLDRMHKIRRELYRNKIAEVTAPDQTLRDDVPMLELDHEGRLLRMNGPAGELFRLHPLLTVGSGRALALRGAARTEFRQAIGSATENEAAQAATVDLAQIRAADGRIIPGLRLNLIPRSDGGRRVLIVVTSENERALQRLFDAPQEKIRLTQRERDVLNGLLRGRRRDQLAHDLELALPTIDLHSANLRKKLGARTTAEAVAIALRLGLA